jgi:broad specificity phosphatase PhoE
VVYGGAAREFQAQGDSTLAARGEAVARNVARELRGRDAS